MESTELKRTVSGLGANRREPQIERGRESFFKKIVDPKIETAIYTAPQVRGPFRTVFAKIESSKEICKKLLTMTKT